MGSPSDSSIPTPARVLAPPESCEDARATGANRVAFLVSLWMQSRSQSAPPGLLRRLSSGSHFWIFGLYISLLLVSAAELRSLDFSGNIRLLWTDTQFQRGATNGTEQQYTLELRQDLSPFLRARLTYDHFQISTRPEESDSFGRRFRQPRFELLYNRPNVTARLGYGYRLSDGSFDPDNFESQGINGTLFWRILPRLSLNLSFRDDVNETDPGAFGRDTTTRRYRATIRYNRAFWGASYSFSNSSLRNDFSGLASDQDRHDLQINGSRDFFRQRLTLSFNGSGGYAERVSSVSEGADLAEPIPAAAGLFAVDLTPAIGDLEPSPGLIDGDVVTPVSPPIEIGAANTFRNIGVDLGITRPISRLEIAVDRPSSPNVIWEVFTSRDNLFWQPLLGARSAWDGDLLRYTLSFPETEDRFFKAVNVSVNGADQVNVTEIRPLLDRPDAIGQELRETGIYQADFAALYRFTTRVTGSIGLGSSNNRTTSADLLLQDFRADYATAGLNADLARNLQLTIGYRLTDSQQGSTRPLDRTTEEGTASLVWTPLPTLDLNFSGTTRDEKERSELLQSVKSSRVAVALQLLTDLRLVADVSYNRLEDPFSGFDRDSYNGSLRFDSRPFRNWFLGGGYSYLLTETPEQQSLLDRNNVFLQTSWAPGSYLVLNATWRYFIDDFSDNLRQTYGLSYTPGPRLSVSATWENFDTSTGRRTGNASAGILYRLFRHVRFSARLSRSTFEQNGVLSENINSAQVGLIIGF